MKKRYLFLGLLALLLLPLAYQQFSRPAFFYQEIPVLGSVQADDQEALTPALEVLLLNNQASNEGDLEGYLDTLVPSARAETGQELESFFEEYKLHTVIDEIKVVHWEPDRITLRVTQTTKDLNESDYRDHVAISGVTLRQEADQGWLIAETIMEETFFI